MYQRENIMRWSLYFLWTNGLDPTRSNLLNLFCRYISLVSNIAVIVISSLELHLNWNGVQTVAKLDVLPNSYLCLGKLLCLIYYRNIFSKLVESTKKCWSLTDIRVYYKICRAKTYSLSFKLYKIYLVICFMTVLVLSFKPMITGNRILPFPGYDICNLNNSLCFYSHAGFQVFHIAFQLYPISMGFDGLFVSLIIIIFMEMKMIKHFLKITIKQNGKYERSNNGELIRIIKHHVFILKLIKYMNYVYSNILFVMYWTSMGSSTFSIYMMTRNGVPPNRELFLKYGPYFINILLQVALYCASGAILMNQVSSLSNAIFSTEWWTKDNLTIRKTLCFMMQRAQKEDKLTVGRMLDLNLVTYIQLLRHMMSIYTLLDNLSNNNLNV